ncbi:MAG: recombinase RecA [Candidatus Melainabacteria bacterium]|nr:recombinase RecA [Candidatus Melainabacteria bacterium]
MVKTITKEEVKEKGRDKSEVKPDERSEKLKALSLTLEKIEKDFGKGSVMRLGEARYGVIDAIPTGAISLDLALGVGGVPRGRVIEIFGPESSGKTTVAMHICAQAQKLGGIAAIVDAEHALDPDYARALGVNTDDLLISQPDTGEQALEITEQLVRSGAIDVVVIDSVAALVPKAEIEGEMGDSHMGLQARLMSQALRKLTGIVSKTKSVIIFINQMRQKIGVMYGPTETTTGGNALKYYASLRLDVRKIETLKKDNVEYGNRIKVKVVKNKVAPPFRVAEFDLLYGKGISFESSLLDVACNLDVVQKSGTWFTYNSDKLGQGREKAVEALSSNQKMMKEIESKVRTKIQELRAQHSGAIDSSTESGWAKDFKENDE